MDGRKRSEARSSKAGAFFRTPECDHARRANIEKANAVNREAPKCGALSRTSGQPCKKVALENGRCRIHGGKTPKGDQWHKPQFPGPGAPFEKYEKKLAELERRRKHRAARLAAMTPEERAKHDAWHKARKPGGRADRERGRMDRGAKELLAKTGARRPKHPDARALAKRIAELERPTGSNGKRES